MARNSGIRSFADNTGAAIMAQLAARNLRDVTPQANLINRGLQTIGETPSNVQLREILQGTTPENFEQNRPLINALMASASKQSADAAKERILSGDKALQRASTEGIANNQISSMEKRLNTLKYVPTGNGMFQLTQFDNLGNTSPAGKPISKDDMLAALGQAGSSGKNKGAYQLGWQLATNYDGTDMTNAQYNALALKYKNHPDVLQGVHEGLKFKEQKKINAENRTRKLYDTLEEEVDVMLGNTWHEDGVNDDVLRTARSHAAGLSDPMKRVEYLQYVLRAAKDRDSDFWGTDISSTKELEEAMVELGWKKPENKKE